MKSRSINQRDVFFHMMRLGFLPTRRALEEYPKSAILVRACPRFTTNSCLPSLSIRVALVISHFVYTPRSITKTTAHSLVWPVSPQGRRRRHDLSQAGGTLCYGGFLPPGTVAGAIDMSFSTSSVLEVSYLLPACAAGRPAWGPGDFAACMPALLALNSLLRFQPAAADAAAATESTCTTQAVGFSFLVGMLCAGVHPGLRLWIG